MRIRSAVTAGLAVTFASGLAVVGAAGGAARVNPIDLSIAKEKAGPYKANGLFTDQPATSPQVQKRAVESGKTAKFFLRMKNPNAGVIGDYIGGDPSTSDFQVTYTLNGENITDQMTPDCQFREVPANGNLTIQMKVKATGASSGDSDFFGVYLSDSSMCVGLDDLVWAKVKAK